MPESLPPDLEQKLRKTLLRCGPFAGDRELRAVFVDTRIARWRDDIPDNTPSRGKRVSLFIESLCDQRDSAGNNALALVLHVLAERTAPGDSCRRELADLGSAIQNVAAATATDTAVPVPTTQGTKYEIHVHEGGQVGTIGDNTHIEGGINLSKSNS